MLIYYIYYYYYQLSYQDMKIKSCLYNSCCIISVILGVALVAIEIFFIEGLVRAQAEDGIVMTNQTYGLWGIIPGDTETFTIRNFTVFNFTNSNDFIYKGSVTPTFVQTGEFLYQEKSQFINYFFSEEATKVNYDYWLYFNLLPESRSVEQKFNVINVAPLGFWMQLDSVPITTFALQGFGGLFVQMNNTIKMQAIGQGVSGQFLKDYDTFVFICKQLAIEDKLCWHLWNDRYYGLNNEVNLQFWVKASYYSDQSTKQCLYEHFFPLPAIQFEGLLLEIGQLSQSINQVLDNWFCKSDEKCDSYKFTLKQISSAGITNNPPPGSEAIESICSTNQTCVGSPQILTFLHHEFKKINPDSKYQQLQFSEETLTTLFTPYEGLLNIGTLNEIYAAGSAFDKSKDEKYLTELTKIFNTKTIDHSFVLWEWIKYMTNQFVLKIGRGGSRKIAGLGGVFSQALYEVTFSFANWFLQDTYSFLAYKKIGENCKQVLNFLSASVAQKICGQLIPDSKNYTNFYSIIEPCLNHSKFYTFKSQYNVTATKMQQYCDIDQDPSNIGLIVIEIMEIVQNQYSCKQSNPIKKCTEIDIIVKQIFNSEITRNPLYYKDYPYYNRSCSSIHSWNPEIPAFEYQHYLQLSDIEDPQQHLQSQTRDLFTFDKLLNGPAVQELFITDNDIDFYHKYHWVNPSYLRNYIRFVVLEVGFGGFTQQRSPKQIFFGYTDPFLQTLKQTDTMAGGDPSIQSLIAFNELNLTKQEAKINKQVMFTGQGDTKKTRQYVSLFEKSYIVVNNTYYDGKDVKWEMKTPWAEDVQLEGSDGFSVPPNIDKSDTPPVYISSIARFANVEFKKTLRKYDMELWDMRIAKDALQSDKENPSNAKYYQGIHSFLNSSYQGFPLFVSKNHFLDAQQKWANLVNIVDQRGNKMKANDWDDTRLYVEPYTGTAFSATVFLQSNYYYQPNDILFPSSELFRNKRSNSNISEDSNMVNRMLPIVNTFRSGNISDNAVDKYFGDLRDIINNKRKVALTGWILIALCFMTWIGVKLAEKINKDKQKTEKESKSLLSENSANQ